MTVVRISFSICVLIIFGTVAKGQLADSCNLKFGTNLGGLADYGTEIPFVDLMRTCRTWYTKSVGDRNEPFNSGFTDKLTYREDGYPTHIPQNVEGSQFPQRVVTIWAITDGWPAGEYTLLWEGEGEFGFWGSHKNLNQTDDHRIIFDFPSPKEGIFEMTIKRSEKDNPIRNVRLLMPGTENTYKTQPFYDLWLEKLDPFKTVRFMDWGQTNNWGQANGEEIADDGLVDWDGRSQMDHYTWAYSKGVPYEMMVALMNQQEIDGWVCVPHTASEDYIRKMARYFRDYLEPGRHITVEYSNEIWNWIFGQTHWANKYGVEATGDIWPEGIVGFIQRMLNYWTEEFQGKLDKTTRVVGVQTGWTDVVERVVRNVDPKTFDAVAATYYFSFDEAGDKALDKLGASATVDDAAHYIRQNMSQNLTFIDEVQSIAHDEGGQHFTPHPFGEEPSYAQALLDIQRDTTIYHLYQEWFSALRSIHKGKDRWLMMNFSFVSARSARYGSWGILESLDQDLNQIPAPKYRAILDNIKQYNNCETLTAVEDMVAPSPPIMAYPNPASGQISFKGMEDAYRITVYNMAGQIIKREIVYPDQTLEIYHMPPGLFFLRMENMSTGDKTYQKVVKVK